MVGTWKTLLTIVLWILVSCYHVSITSRFLFIISPSCAEAKSEAYYVASPKAPRSYFLFVMHFSCMHLQASKPLPHSGNPTRIATLKLRCMLYFLSNILKSIPQSFWQKYQVNLVAACTTGDKPVINSSHSYNRLPSQPSSISRNLGLICILHHAFKCSATLFRSSLLPLSATQA
jgi:hypothetical protein